MTVNNLYFSTPLKNDNTEAWIWASHLDCRNCQCCHKKNNTFNHHLGLQKTLGNTRRHNIRTHKEIGIVTSHRNATISRDSTKTYPQITILNSTYLSNLEFLKRSHDDETSNGTEDSMTIIFNQPFRRRVTRQWSHTCQAQKRPTPSCLQTVNLTVLAAGGCPKKCKDIRTS
jgi:hypothetical protein